MKGTKIDNRDNFHRMINDAMNGKLDLILVKSISRFARNTVDTLQFVRKLKDKNVAIHFEEENINTLSMDGELLLTILGAVAQQEVQNASEHVKKGVAMKLQRGEMYGNNSCLGYDYHPETQTLTINEKEAEIVRYIFKRYLEGAGGTVIANELTNLGYKNKRGDVNWMCSTVLGIIKNEKYKGDLLMGKTFTRDPISKKRLTNMGEVDQYYTRNHHEAIISPEKFDPHVFECIIDRVIVGETTEDGVTHPYTITFVFKTGTEDKVALKKQPKFFDDACSLASNSDDIECLHCSDNARGNRVSLGQSKSRRNLG